MRKPPPSANNHNTKRDCFWFLKHVLSDYTPAKEHWDRVFSGLNDFDPSEPLHSESIELGLRWLCDGSLSVIDFGCGNARILLRCLTLGIEKGTGIDISPVAIAIAEKIAAANGLQDRCQFQNADVSSLANITSHSHEAGILFNTIENLSPKDGIRVVEQLRRILKPNGKLLLKLNDYINPEVLTKKQGYQLLSESFYKDSSGLFIWNLSNEMLERLISPRFISEKFEKYRLEDSNHFNRLHYLKAW